MPLLNNEGITRQELSSDLNEELNEIGILSEDVNKNTSDITNLQDAHNAHLAKSVSQVGGVHGLEVEEGTFTPYFDLLPGNTITYSQRTGKYMKIGNLVHLSVRLTLTSVNITNDQNLYIRGLPFVGTSVPVPASFVFSNLNVISYSRGVVQGSISTDSISLQWVHIDGGVFINMLQSALKSDTDLRVSLTYKLD